MLDKGLAIDLLLPTRQRPRRPQNLLQTPVIIRMGIEYAVIADRRLSLTTPGRLFTSEVFLILQHLDHFDHRLRIIATARQVLGTQAIGLQLHVTTVATHEGAAEDAGQVVT